MTETAVGRAVVAGREPDRSGKVRDLFFLGDTILIVTTDRISAFDRVLPTLIPGKGKVLTKISSFWFDRLASIVLNHKISVDPRDYPEPFRAAAETLEGRSMLVRRGDVFPFECVVRGYLAGSGWKEYAAGGSISGVPLPKGLRLSDKLPEPIFTPTTKAEGEHDQPVTFADVERALGKETARELRDTSIRLFSEATRHAEARGILLADTKFEFARIGGKIHLVDEVLSPDSSRFWKAAGYRPGEPQESFDKQFVREFLLGIQWRGEEPAPPLPDEVVAATIRRYREILEILTA
ncbi:MAG: phosphoribosylaminoimidazolesuccinocarboxamide synthase [Candidatus Latescibacterota bacterium]|nr:MAG: phosphoribosylaminoimidazolesuccinocarboxamide synthase [Candidatus Latescibacterota bacterium]